jgi:ATP-binding cassette, subfamily A (ABC1), member 3
LLSMLSGTLAITSGNAFIFGHDIQKEKDVIRSFIGVCPQHDLFWPNLTAYEHLSLYASIKGISFENINKEVTRLLKRVKLLSVASGLVSTFSGGMKRRLSVAMSLIGNPSIGKVT